MITKWIATKPWFALFIRWQIVILFIPLGIMIGCIGIWGLNRHYPELSELQYISAEISDISIRDGDRHHTITLLLKGFNIPFYFQKVDYFPEIKKTLPLAKSVELWVDRDQLDKGEPPDIWQFKIDDKMMMSRESITTSMRERARYISWGGAIVFVLGILFGLMARSKNQTISQKLYPGIILMLRLSLYLVLFYLLVIQRVWK